MEAIARPLEVHKEAAQISNRRVCLIVIRVGCQFSCLLRMSVANSLYLGR